MRKTPGINYASLNSSSENILIIKVPKIGKILSFSVSSLGSSSCEWERLKQEMELNWISELGICLEINTFPKFVFIVKHITL